MNDYLVRFVHLGEIYEIHVRASSSGSALKLIESTYAGSKNITVVSFK